MTSTTKAATISKPAVAQQQQQEVAAKKAVAKEVKKEECAKKEVDNISFPLAATLSHSEIDQLDKRKSSISSISSGGSIPSSSSITSIPDPTVFLTAKQKAARERAAKAKAAAAAHHSGSTTDVLIEKKINELESQTDADSSSSCQFDAKEVASVENLFTLKNKTNETCRNENKTNTTVFTEESEQTNVLFKNPTVSTVGDNEEHFTPTMKIAITEDCTGTYREDIRESFDSERSIYKTSTPGYEDTLATVQSSAQSANAVTAKGKVQY